jgi:hypothetical protein
MSRSEIDEKELKSSTFCAVKDQVSCELDGEAVILQMGTGTYYGLNEVGRSIWDFIQQSHTYDEIMAKMLEEYDVERGQLDRDLSTLLRNLMAAGLVEVSGHRP